MAPLHEDFYDLTKTTTICPVWVKYGLTVHHHQDKALACLLSVKANKKRHADMYQLKMSGKHKNKRELQPPRAQVQSVMYGHR